MNPTTLLSPSWPDLRPFIGELWLVAAIVGVLLMPFFLPRSNVACALTALFGLIGALVSVLWVASTADAGHDAFRGMLVTDPFALFWKALLLIFVIGIVGLWFATSRTKMHSGDAPEFFTLLLGATLGMALMGSTSNLLMLLLSVELASLPSYVLAGFRKTDRIGAEASLKYVLFGAATSSVMAYGLSLLYGLYGTLNVGELAAHLHVGANGGAFLTVALFGLIVGLGFKIAAVPFHFWCPDVFEGAGIDVAAFLSVASKGAGLVLLLRVLMTIAHGLDYQAVQPLTTLAVVVGILGAVTATVGNTAALAQTNIKRLLAYSSIAHAGYMLCVVSMLYRPSATERNPGAAAAQALLTYLAIYLFMNLGAFTVAGVVARFHGGGRQGEQIGVYAGLGSRAPVLAACMAVFMFSLVGLPPFAGFAAKLNVMVILGANGSGWWLLVVAIGLNTIFSLYYYARVIKTMYLDSPADDIPVIFPSALGTGMSVVCAGMLVAMLVGFGPLRNLAGERGQLYFPPDIGAMSHADTSPLPQALLAAK